MFLTAVCRDRTAILQPDHEKECLLTALRAVKEHIPFRLFAYVLLDEHIHLLIAPDVANDFPRIMQSLKLRYSRSYKQRHALHGNVTLWQPRYWDHVIRDQDDLHRHMDYIHYNPVKHGYAEAAGAYVWSSFRTHVAHGHYPHAWGSEDIPASIAALELE